MLAPAGSPTVCGRYRVLEEIGRGAMGIVYLAEDPLIGRKVALKTLRLGTIMDHDLAHELRERFLREARAAGILQHPAIVMVFDVGEDPEQEISYLTMEYVRGRNLKQMLRDGVRFTPARVAEIGAALAGALDYAHRNGIVHRDVKPANVLLTEDGHAKITDFGIARVQTSDLTLEGQSLGTPNYMSPEQAQGRPVDHRTDVFSLGIVLFELLSGRKPFHGENVSATCYQIVHEPQPRLEHLVAEHLQPFDDVLGRALAKRPDDRFPSAKEMAAALERLRRDSHALPAVAVPAAESGSGDGHASALPTLPTPHPGRHVEAETVFVPPEARESPATGSGEPSRRETRADDGAPAERTHWTRPLPTSLAVTGLVAVAAITAALFWRPLAELGRQRTEEPTVVSARETLNKRALLAEAEAHVATGRTDEARRVLEQILELAPGNVRAKALLAELDRPPEPAPPTPAPVAPPIEPAAESVPAGVARVALRFESPEIGRGFLIVYAGSRQAMREEIDWKEKTGLFSREEKGGVLERTFEVAPGAQDLRVQFVDPKRGLSAIATIPLVLREGREQAVSATLDETGKTITLRGR